MRADKFVLQFFVLVVVAAMALSACVPATTATQAPAQATAAPAATATPEANAAPTMGVIDTLAAACKSEGMLTIIATPAS
jgi:hypothetical protein